MPRRRVGPSGDPLKHTPLLSALLAILLVPGALATPVGEALGPACSDSDTSSGFGGQDVGCAFECEAGHNVSVEVTAVDEDASVSGQAVCGDATPQCGDGSHTCSAEQTTTQAGAGSCEGHSSEFADSGLTVACSADPVPCEEECPEDERGCELIDLCLDDIVTFRRATLVFDGVHATGTICTERGCVAVVPFCFEEKGGLTCRI